MRARRLELLTTRIANLEAALARGQKVLDEGKGLLNDRGRDTCRRWVQKKKPIAPLLGLLTGVSVAIGFIVGIFIYNGRVIDSRASLTASRERLWKNQEGIPTRRKQIAAKNKTLVDLSFIARDTRLPSAIPSVVERRYRRLLRTGAKAPPRIMLEWLNVGLAACTVGNNKVAADAWAQLGIFGFTVGNDYLMRTKLSRLTLSERMQALMLRTCSPKGVSLLP